MTYRIYGTSKHSPLQISHALSALRVSHTLTVNRETRIVNKKRPQPRAVHVTDELAGYRKGAVNFIVASLAELGMTNYMPLAYQDLTDALKCALLSDSTINPKITKLSELDYVNLVAKPSLLNKIQTEIYKIQPYALRKQTQQTVLDYLNSRVSKKGLRDALSNNLKHETLLPLVLSAESLRNAVARLDKETPEEIAADTGHPTFELLYLSKERKK